jgi:hypothetical protein
MAEYSRREVVTRRVEYVMPRPVNAAQFSEAFAAASQEWRRLYPGREPADNSLWIDAGDGKIILSFVAPPAATTDGRPPDPGGAA